MDNKDFFASEQMNFTSKLNDFDNIKNTMDFLSSERSEEKVDTEKQKEKNVDDFLNFQDDFGSDATQSFVPATAPFQADTILIPSVETREEEKVKSQEPELDFSAIEDDYLNAYGATKETNNEKFISSEDLLTDFKDPVAEEVPEEPKKKEPVPEVPKPLPTVAEKKPVEEPKPQVKKSSDDTQIEAEKIFKSIGLDSWFKPDKLHPKVESLIYWRDVKKSGVVFGIGLAILLAMSMFSLISVFAYLSIITLAGTIAFRIYKTIMSAVQKTSDGHPFKEFLDIDLTLSQDRAQQIASVIVTHVNAYVAELRRLFLVEDLVDSLKFGLLLWLLTYIGAIFNGMTVVILAYVAMFTLPKVYETNKQNIDQYLDLVRSKIVEITDKVKAAIPLGKKEESAKDK